MTPYNVVRDFEQALCDYTGAPYAVTTNSCTMAILLAMRYMRLYSHSVEKGMWTEGWNDGDYGAIVGPYIVIPRRTYVSVPMSIIHAECNVRFLDYKWKGAYRLKPSPVFDSARRFFSLMYNSGEYQCVSFHASKILGDTQGGAILHDDPVADKWFRKARFDGRTEGVHPADDTFDTLGYHCYMSPDVAARLHLKLSVLPKFNEDLPNDDYPDLSKMEIFRGR